MHFSGGLRDAEPEAVVAKLEETGLEPTGAHELYAESLGCSRAVVPYLGEEHFEPDAAVDATAERLGAVAEAAAAYDWPIRYHNYDHEPVDLGSEWALDLLLERADTISLELDVGWALVGGADPVGLIETFDDRIDLLHMKDMDADERTFREIGEGDIERQACAGAAREADVECVVYEHDDTEDPAASIETAPRSSDRSSALVAEPRFLIASPDRAERRDRQEQYLQSQFEYRFFEYLLPINVVKTFS